jgi:xanthine/uracil permease
MFSRSHPGALGSRFDYVSYVSPTSSWIDVGLRFFVSYAGSFNPWLWLVSGDPEPRHHVQTMGSLLAASVVLAMIGLVMVLVRSRLRNDPWWRFVIYGLAVAPIPSSLTIDHFHTLRLVAVPIFLLILMVPALSWLLEAQSRRPILALLLVGVLVQGALFRWQFHRASPTRWHNFDTFYPEVFQAAISLPNRPIYLIDNHGAPGYVHAYWYATLAGIDTSEFVVFPKEQRPPSGSLVVSTEWPCSDCQMILERGSFRAYLQK